MAEISTTILMDGLTLSLHQAFPLSKIHIETIEQDLAEGDMLVKLVNMGQTDDIGMRVNRAQTFDIAYFGETNEQNLYASDALTEAVKKISLPTGDKVKGTGISITTVDEVLHCTVSYDYRAYKPISPRNKMTSLEVKTHG